MVWKNTFEKYLGQWSNNFQNGLGIHIWYEHKGEQKYFRNRYVGEWKNGCRNGYGVFFYANGGKYEGMWENNIKNGFGIFTSHDGSQTIGKFVNDRHDNNMTNSIPGANSSKTSTLNGTGTKLGKNFKKNVPKTQILQAVIEDEENEGQAISNPKAESLNKNENTESGSKLKNDITINSLNIVDSKTIISNINHKMMELNPFKTLLDLSDIIEIDPDLESSMIDTQNLLLRHLSEMKNWYKYYLNNREIQTNDLNDSRHHSQNKMNKITDPKEKDNLHDLLNKEHQNDPVIDNNDFGYALEMKDFWKFMKESNILSSDFTISGFNRFFFRGPKNYIEMFQYPEEHRIYSQEFYDYIYQLVEKSKDDFMFKYRDKMKSSASVFSGPQDLINNSLKPSDSENKIDIHYKKNCILLRQFYEAIVRIAYLKYYSTGETLNNKIKYLIETIKTNPNFKKAGKRPNMTHTNDSSTNSTIVILDLKPKIYESNFEHFSKTYDKQLKAIFNNLFLKSSNCYKKFDKTISNRFFFESIVKRSNLICNLVDKYKLYEFLTIYHKDKVIIKEDNRTSAELNRSIENVLNNEAIFYEISELIYLCARFYLLQNSIPDKIDHYNQAINHFLEVSITADLVYVSNDKYIFNLPKLKNHKIIDSIIEAKKQKKLEEERIIIQKKKLDNERNWMIIEDFDILPPKDDDEDSNLSDESNL